MDHEFSKNNYEKSLTSKCWVCTPLDAGWDEAVDYGVDLPNHSDLKQIFELEMSLDVIPSWAEEVATSQINNFPMCGHYLFPNNVEEILEALKTESSIDFFTSCYTVAPERKYQIKAVIRILEGWLTGKTVSETEEFARVFDRSMFTVETISKIYDALGESDTGKVSQVLRLKNRLEWWVRTFIWKGESRDTFNKASYPGADSYPDSDYGNKGFHDPYFVELDNKANKELEKEILKARGRDDGLIDQIHSTWLCAPKIFRYLEKILNKIGDSDLKVFPADLTEINTKHFCESYDNLITQVNTIISAKKDHTLIGEFTPVKEWLLRILMLKLDMYKEHCPFGRLIT